MRRLINSGLLGAADQALLSAFNLGIGLLFIHAAEKQEYATYALIFAALMLVQSVQNAVVTSPMTTLHASHTDASDKSGIAAAARWLQVRMMVVVLALIAGYELLSWLTSGSDGLAQTALAMSLAALGLLSREYARAHHYLSLQPGRALFNDVIYVALSSAWLLFIWNTSMVSADYVLAGVGIAGILTGSIMEALRGTWRGAVADSKLRESLAEFWSCTRWALPSIVISWAYANGFIYLIDHFMGKESVADVSAARLLIVPISLLVTGWASAFRPRGSRLLAAHRIGEIDRAIRYSALAFVAVGVVYGGALALAYPHIVSRLLGEKYGNLELLVACWLVFFTVTAVRSVGMSAMLSSKASFKPLFLFGAVTLVIAAVLCSIAAAAGSEANVVAGLAAAEIFLGCVIWFKGWPAIKRLAGSMPPRGVTV